MLKKVASLADSLDYEGMKKAVLPAVHALCLSTTSGESPGGKARVAAAGCGSGS